MSDPKLQAALFRNERKQSDNQPDFTGPGSVSPEDLKRLYEMAVSGEGAFDDKGQIKIRVAGWKKQSSAGNAYISLAITPERPQQQITPTPAKPLGDDFL
jgi:hypothetical protein